MAEAVLITGGAGYLARRLARRFLERGGREVVLWLRPDEARCAALRHELAGFGDRLHVAFGDLTEDEPFASVDPASIGIVVHAAAVTRFNVERELARAVNVEGTRRLLLWAKRCPRLESFTLLSTIYTSGLRDGILAEEPLERPPSFANHYERSKWEAERMVVEAAGQLPWRILRISTLIADDRDGSVTQRNAFHNTLQLLYYGLLSLVPGDQATPVYLATGRFAVDAVHELAEGDHARSVFHVCHERAASATLGELVDVAFRRFEEDEGFRRRRVLRPLFCAADTFELLASGVGSFAGPVVTQGLRSVLPFAPQLFSEKTVENRRLTAALSGYEAPDARALIDRTCAHLVRTRWGRKEEHGG